jgi:tetratricopeptide (TPR) repeat protein
MKRSRKSVPIYLLSIVVSLGSSQALAEPSSADKAIAEKLFQEGRALMEAKNYERACPKFLASFRIDRMDGSLLNLAVCHHRQGKLATAWAEYRQVLGRVKAKKRPDRVELVEKSLREIGPLIPKISFHVAHARSEQGLRIFRNGSEVFAAAWNTELPVDPGPQLILVTQKGKRTWEKTIEAEKSTNQVIEVPELKDEEAPLALKDPPIHKNVEPADTPRAKPVASEPKASSSFPWKTIGWVGIGLGVAAGGVGTVFGIQTLLKKKSSDSECPQGPQSCSPQGVQDNERAYTLAKQSNILLGSGLLLAGTGIVMLLLPSTSDSSKSRALSSPSTWNVGVISSGFHASWKAKW